MYWLAPRCWFSLDIWLAYKSWSSIFIGSLSHFGLLRRIGSLKVHGVHFFISSLISLGFLIPYDSLLSTVFFSRLARFILLEYSPTLTRWLDWSSLFLWLAFINGFLPPSDSLPIHDFFYAMARFLYLGFIAFLARSRRRCSYILQLAQLFVFIQTLTRLSCMVSSTY